MWLLEPNPLLDQIPKYYHRDFRTIGACISLERQLLKGLAHYGECLTYHGDSGKFYLCSRRPDLVVWPYALPREVCESIVNQIDPKPVIYVAPAMPKPPKEKIVLKPCRVGFEPLEGEIKKAIGARPDEPVPPSLQARFLGLLSIAQRARGAPQEIDKELDGLQDEAATVLLGQDRQNKTAREEAPLLAARVAALNEDATEEELEAAKATVAA